MKTLPSVTTQATGAYFHFSERVLWFLLCVGLPHTPRLSGGTAFSCRSTLDQEVGGVCRWVTCPGLGDAGVQIEGHLEKGRGVSDLKGLCQD